MKGELAKFNYRNLRRKWKTLRQFFDKRVTSAKFHRTHEQHTEHTHECSGTKWTRCAAFNTNFCTGFVSTAHWLPILSEAVGFQWLRQFQLGGMWLSRLIPGYGSPLCRYGSFKFVEISMPLLNFYFQADKMLMSTTAYLCIVRFIMRIFYFSRGKYVDMKFNSVDFIQAFYFLNKKYSSWFHCLKRDIFFTRRKYKQAKWEMLIRNWIIKPKSLKQKIWKGCVSCWSTGM